MLNSLALTGGSREISVVERCIQNFGRVCVNLYESSIGRNIFGNDELLDMTSCNSFLSRFPRFFFFFNECKEQVGGRINQLKNYVDNFL